MAKPKTADAGTEDQRKQAPRFDFSKIGKSKRLAKQNKDYLDLLSVVEKSRHGFAAEHARLQSKPAKDAAKQLLRQLDLIFDIVRLPYMILITMEGSVDAWASAFRQVLGIGHRQEDKRKRFEKQAKSTMQNFFALDVSGSLARPWLYATTVYIWTAFECLAGDLWTNSLNHTTTLAHRALNSIPNEDAEHFGLSRRQIDVGLAARYGFDLRRCLGTLLKPRFDFSSFDGIEAAYKHAFGTYGGLEEYRGLKELEQVRHLIVHRGGVTDDKFARVTKLKARRNAPLSLTLSQVGDYMVIATLGCLALLKVVDDWFTAKK